MRVTYFGRPFNGRFRCSSAGEEEKTGRRRRRKRTPRESSLLAQITLLGALRWAEPAGQVAKKYRIAPSHTPALLSLSPPVPERQIEVASLAAAGSHAQRGVLCSSHCLHAESEAPLWHACACESGGCGCCCCCRVSCWRSSGDAALPGD